MLSQAFKGVISLDVEMQRDRDVCQGLPLEYSSVGTNTLPFIVKISKIPFILVDTHKKSPTQFQKY